MNLKRRLESLRALVEETIECPACDVRKVEMHDTYELPTGEVVYVPPRNPAPVCTCNGRKKSNQQRVTQVCIAYLAESLEEVMADLMKHNNGVVPEFEIVPREQEGEEKDDR